MNDPTLNPTFSAAIEQELAAIGTSDSRLQRAQRRARGFVAAVGALALVGAVTGAAVVVNGLPGETTTAPLGTIVSGTYTGTASMSLGPAPKDATSVILRVRCLSAGTLEFWTLPQGGATRAVKDQIRCTGSERSTTSANGATVHDALLPPSGSMSITIHASPNTRWRATAQYGRRDASAWGVNANGQTYGAPNGNGLPDLQAAQATNGMRGYVFTEEVMAMDRSGYLNVYESDGTTVIGKFPVGNEGDWSYDVTTDAPGNGDGR